MIWVHAGPPGAMPVRLDERWLTAVERERAARFRFAADRESFVAAHALVRVCAADLLDTSPERLALVQRCVTCGGPHGRPTLAEHPEVTVTLSHVRGYVAAAASYGPVGVDVEVVDDRPLDWTLVRSVLPASEIEEVAAAPDPSRAFLRRWVHRECLVKVGAAELGAPVRLSEAGWSFRDWTDPAGRVVGSVVTPPGTEVTLQAT